MSPLSKERKRIYMREYRKALKESGLHVLPKGLRYYRKGVVYKAGDKVIYKGNVVEVPETDLDGNILWE